MAVFSLELIIVVISVFLLSLFFLRFRGRKHNDPPVVRNSSIFGVIPNLGKYAYETLANMRQKYGNVFVVHMGFTPVLVLNNWVAVKEAFIGQPDVFAGRPEVFLLMSIFKNKDIVFSDSHPIWKQQRRFLLSVLRDMGVGKSRAEMIITEEAEDFMKKLQATSGKPIFLHDSFLFQLLNVIWTIAAGHKLLQDLNELKEFERILNENFIQYNAAHILNYLPFIRYLIPGGLGFWKQVENHKKLRKFLEKEIEDHKKTFIPGNEVGDVIDAYLEEMHQHQSTGSRDGRDTHPFTEARLVFTLHNLFNAGAETTATTLTWSIMYMTLWPDIQAKVQEELDNVIGRGRLTTYNDRNQLPYCEVVLLEIQRYAAILPLAIPHKTSKRTQIFGYDIPAKMTVIANLWAIHHDPETWGDPEVFRPERFFGPDGKINKPEYFAPFSVGSRMCLGEKLARMELFIFFTNILNRFSFRLPRGTRPPTMKPIVGITLRPQVFEVIAEVRR